MAQLPRKMESVYRSLSDIIVAGLVSEGDEGWRRDWRVVDEMR